MSATQAAQRYSKTFYHFMEEQALVELSVRDAEVIVLLAKSAPRLQATLTNEVIPNAQKLVFLTKLFSEQLHQQTNKFMRFMLAKGRSALIVPMAECYLQLYRERSGVLQAHLETAFPLSPTVQAALEQRFSTHLAKTLELKTVIRPQLLGGFTLRVVDKLYDYSLNGALTRLKEKL